MYVQLKKLYYRAFGQPRRYLDDLPYFAQARSILDVPCGQGHFLSIDPARLAGVDLNRAAIDKCLERNLNAREADALALPFAPESFDGVHCAHLIEHLMPADAAQLLRELDRVLKPGGVLLLRTPLAGRTFFNDPSHIRPYPPSAVFGLLNMTADGDPTIVAGSFDYRFVDLKFFRRKFFELQYEVAVAPKRYAIPAALKALGLLLDRCGIRHWQRAEYRLVLSKAPQP